MKSIAKVGVIGAGTMGSGIAQACAVAGIGAVMVDVGDAAVEHGMKNIAGSLERLVKKEKLTALARDRALARVAGTTDYSELRDADLIIEAATENVEIKVKVLKQVDAIAKSGAVIASNTSSISITALAAVVTHPTHFLGPFFQLRAADGAGRADSGPADVGCDGRRHKAFAEKLGKTPIVVKNSPGFVVNRLLCPMINEAIFVFQEGLASAEDIDNGMKLGCNHPIGPLALADMIGLDVMLAVMNVFYDDFNDPKYRPAPLLKEMVAAGRLGRKSGRGFYVY